jgi:hypothetical protein
MWGRLEYLHSTQTDQIAQVAQVGPMRQGITDWGLSGVWLSIIRSKLFFGQETKSCSLNLESLSLPRHIRKRDYARAEKASPSLRVESLTEKTSLQEEKVQT